MSSGATRALCGAALIALLLAVSGRGGAGMPSEKSGSGGGTVTRRERYWVLKGTKRDFYICATAGRRDWRTALCVFDSRGGAEEHLASLGEARMFLDTLERYGASMPDWMRRDPLLPEVCEVPARNLRPILRAIGVEYATLNPPPAGERVEDLELLPAEAFPHDGEAEIPNGSSEETAPSIGMSRQPHKDRTSTRQSRRRHGP